MISSMTIYSYGNSFSKSSDILSVDLCLANGVGKIVIGKNDG